MPNVLRLHDRVYVRNASFARGTVERLGTSPDERVRVSLDGTGRRVHDFTYSELVRL